MKEGRAERLCFLFDDFLENGIVGVVMTVVIDRFVLAMWLRPTDLMTLWLRLRLRLWLSQIANFKFVASGDVIGGRVCVMDPIFVHVDKAIGIIDWGSKEEAGKGK